jgi:hypothetical protein
VQIRGWVALLDILGSGFWGQIFFLLIFVVLRSRLVRRLWVRSLFDVLLREENELLCGLDLLLEIDLLPAQFLFVGSRMIRLSSPDSLTLSSTSEPCRHC